MSEEIIGPNPCQCGGEYGEHASDCQAGRRVSVTSPSDIPPDVARKIIAARDAIVKGDTFGVWTQLRSISSPEPNIEPWAALEKQAAREAVDKSP